MCDKIFKIIFLVLLAVIVYILIRGTITIRTGKGATKIGLGTGLRSSCLMCVRKHISKAIVLLSESSLGYPQHKWLAMGNLSEAEDESIRNYPELATKIREYRLKIEAGDPNINLMDLIDDATTLSQQKA